MELIKQTPPMTLEQRAELVAEFTTSVWHLMDNSETDMTGPEPVITIMQNDFDDVSNLLDKIESLPSGSTERLNAGELLSAGIILDGLALAAAQAELSSKDDIITRLTTALATAREDGMREAAMCFDAIAHATPAQSPKHMAANYRDRFLDIITKGAAT